MNQALNLARLSTVTGAALWVCSSALAQAVIYPAKGQAPEQQARDESDCYAWAKQQSGFDPSQAASPAAATAPAQPSGQRLRGAARGAAGGAIIGEIADDDAGKGAAIGAVAGGMAAGGQERRAARAEQQQATQQQSAVEAQKATFQRGYAACLEGRGYTVK